jgi:hypothetical protein
VTKVTLSKSGEKNILLDIEANKDDQLEIWGAENHKAAFKKTFGLNLIIRQAIFNSK